MNAATRRAAGTALVLAAAVVVGGCARSVDTEQLQSQIATNIKTQIKRDVEVHCPSDVPAEKGKKVRCRVKLRNGTTVTLQATFVDDNGRFTFVILARTPVPGTPPVAAPPAVTTPPPAATTPAPPATTTPVPATTTPAKP